LRAVVNRRTAHQQSRVRPKASGPRRQPTEQGHSRDGRVACTHRRPPQMNLQNERTFARSGRPLHRGNRLTDGE